MKVSKREKVILGAGIAVAVAILVYYAATTFLPDQERLLGEVEVQKSLLLRQRTLLAQEEFYATRASETQGGLAQVMTQLLPGDNANVAGAELQSILKDYADQNGVEITQKNNLPEQKVPDSDSLVKVSVRITINCNLEGLVSFLTAIENNDKFLKVEELTINTTPAQRQRRYELRPPTLTVAGYINVPAASKPDEKSASATSMVRTTTSTAQSMAGR